DTRNREARDLWVQMHDVARTGVHVLFLTRGGHRERDVLQVRFALGRRDDNLLDRRLIHLLRTRNDRQRRGPGGSQTRRQGPDKGVSSARHDEFLPERRLRPPSVRALSSLALVRLTVGGFVNEGHDTHEGVFAATRPAGSGGARR